MTILISYLVLDMTFTNEGNKTQFDELVNFEKMVSLTTSSPFWLRRQGSALQIRFKKVSLIKC